MEIKDFAYVFHKVGGHDIKFEISDRDYTDKDCQYNGFLSSNGAWIIQRNKTTGTTEENRYAGGVGNYAASWIAKGSWGEAAWVFFNNISI